MARVSSPSPPRLLPGSGLAAAAVGAAVVFVLCSVAVLASLPVSHPAFSLLSQLRPDPHQMLWLSLRNFLASLLASDEEV